MNVAHIVMINHYLCFEGEASDMAVAQALIEKAKSITDVHQCPYRAISPCPGGHPKDVDPELRHQHHQDHHCIQVSGTKKTNAAMGGASKQEAPAAQIPGPGGDE